MDREVFDGGPCGATDNASDYGSEDSRFESWQGRCFFFFFPTPFYTDLHNAFNHG